MSHLSLFPAVRCIDIKATRAWIIYESVNDFSRRVLEQYDITEKGDIITNRSNLQHFSGNEENISPYISFI